jgi:putative hydrolase of the HAD superfamily
MALIVFDGDDTLWVSEPLYDEARQAARRIVESIGLSGARWEELQRVIDVENVKHFGLSAERFPTSCVQAYEALLSETNDTHLVPETRKLIREAANTVFEQPAPLAEGAVDVLDELRTFHQLALLTQGDPKIQRRRIDQSGLEDFFDLNVGVTRKDQAIFRRLLHHFDADPSRSWSVGNSLASDINPALGLGMCAIWVVGHVWEYEQREQIPAQGELFEVRTIRHVPSIITSFEGRRIAQA